MVAKKRKAPFKKKVKAKAKTSSVKKIQVLANRLVKKTPVDHLIMSESKSGKTYFHGSGFTSLKNKAARYHDVDQAKSMGYRVANAYNRPIKIVTD